MKPSIKSSRRTSWFDDDWEATIVGGHDILPEVVEI